MVQGEGNQMKYAQTVKGDPILATPEAPKEAICPSCGGTVTLRSRKTMNNGGKSYFWRHRNNKNPNCQARQRPIG